MIVVVEGISAAGKTTWCRRFAHDRLVPECYPEDRHEQPSSGQSIAYYWMNWNAHRWASAIAVEMRKGQVACDTDPLKLHYIWCLCAIGAARREQWLMQLEATREAFHQKRIGFADLYLVKVIDSAVARRQRDMDTQRARDRFELHVKFQEPLKRWYGSLETVLPGRVEWSLPDHLPTTCADERSPHRYDVELFDAFISALGSPS